MFRGVAAAPFAAPHPLRRLSLALGIANGKAIANEQHPNLQAQSRP
jgi:hypothetical protein